MSAPFQEPQISVEDDAANKAYWSDQAWAWCEAYQSAGFTREEALGLIMSTYSRTHVYYPQSSPETSELMAKLSALLDGDAAE